MGRRTRPVVAALAVAALMAACSGAAAPAGEDASGAAAAPDSGDASGVEAPAGEDASGAAAAPDSGDASIGAAAPLVIAPATTGGELVEQLSAGEAACIRGALGDAGFDGFRGATTVETAGDPAGATFVFFCMAPQNARTYGLAVLDAQAGGRSEATRGCLADLARERPELLPLHLRLEMGYFDSSDAQRFHDTTLAMYACFDDAEKVEYAIRLWERVAAYAPLSGRSFVEVLAADEVSCLRDALPGGGFEALAGTTSMVAGDGVPAGAAGCFGTDTHERIFLKVTSERVGGMQGTTRACLQRFAGEHRDYVRLIAAAETGTVPVAAFGAGAPQDAVIDLARDGWRLFDCFNDEELLRYQLLTSAALSP